VLALVRRRGLERRELRRRPGRGGGEHAPGLRRRRGPAARALDRDRAGAARAAAAEREARGGAGSRGPAAAAARGVAKGERVAGRQARGRAARAASRSWAATWLENTRTLGSTCRAGGATRWTGLSSQAASASTSTS